MKVAGYDDMAPIVPEGEIGDFRITHRIKTWPQVFQDTVLYSPVDWTMRFARTGTYCILWNPTQEETIMSDTDFERVTNQEALQDAHGHVLVGGLGIGMLPYHMCRKKKVKSVIVLEIQPEVIQLVEPHIGHPKLRVFRGNVKRPPRWLPLHRFDYIYLDIWQQVGAAWKELSMLIAFYQKYLTPGGKADAWLSEYIRTFDTLGIAKLPDMSRPLSGWVNRGTKLEMRSHGYKTRLAKKGGRP